MRITNWFKTAKRGMVETEVRPIMGSSRPLGEVPSDFGLYFQDLGQMERRLRVRLSWEEMRDLVCMIENVALTSVECSFAATQTNHSGDTCPQCQRSKVARADRWNRARRTWEERAGVERRELAAGIGEVVE